MIRANHKDMTINQLVECFATIARKQNEALLMNDISKVNRLFDRLEAIEQVLKSRDGDQRRALLRLYDDRNAQVRLKAVKATLAVAPDAARKMLQAIADFHEFPQAGEAGMSIRALNEGIFRPT